MLEYLFLFWIAYSDLKFRKIPPLPVIAIFLIGLTKNLSAFQNIFLPIIFSLAVFSSVYFLKILPSGDFALLSTTIFLFDSIQKLLFFLISTFVFQMIFLILKKADIKKELPLAQSVLFGVLLTNILLR